VGQGMLAMLRYDASETLAAIPVPTLVVTGNGDRICLPEASRWMAQQIPDAELLVLGHARHCGVFEFHQEFNRAVDRFLEARTPRVTSIDRAPHSDGVPT
jgi:pimeloyl-ACP methyl ester carboxylesterase